jgi:hypothetical protein
MSDAVKRALDLVSGYQDPENPKMKDWNWKPLRDVQEKLGGLPEIPSHVERFGAFMDETARRATKGGLTPRDLIKAYAITRSSIQRRAQTADKVRAAGLELPPGMTGMIRPEGAMGEWLHSPMGQRYLDQAERGKVDEEAVAHAQQVMKPFGLNAELDALPWAVQNLGPRHKEVSDLVARALTGQSSPEEWRNFSKDMRGIGTAKAGFVASMLGRGDQPTLDARQVILQTGMPTSEAKKPMAKAGYAAVDRLAARQAALNPKMDSGLEPFRQHLTHHAIWDKAGNEETTHDDVMRAMRGAKDGGRIKYDRSKHIESIRNHPLGAALLRVAGIDPKHSDEQVQAILQRIEARNKMVVNPNEIWKINDPIEKARQIALLQKYDTDVSQNKPTTGGYYNIKQAMAPRDVTSTVGDIPGVTPKPINKMSWEDTLAPRAGGTLIGLGGDRSRLGRMTHINGKELKWPVDLHAGVDYMREPNKGQVWANAKAHAKGIEKMIATAAEKGPILGAFQPMGPQSVDSSHNMADALMAQIDSDQISPADAKEFDEALRAGLHSPDKKGQQSHARQMENWPGILNAKEASEFMRPENGFPGTMRASLAKFMDKSYWRDRGFPHVGQTRAAITEPELLDARGNAVGHRTVELDPEEMIRNVRNSGFIHSTYTEPTGGRYVSDVPLLPRPDVFSEHETAMLAKNISGGHTVHPYAPTNLGRATYRKMTEEQKPWGTINQEMIDRTGMAEERMKRYGYNTGGAVLPDPTEAQKKAGNYLKGHISFQGLPITLESMKGQTRSGVDANGQKWSTKLPYDYGYIKRTEGADGDHVDVCIGPDSESDHVFIIDQHDLRTGNFDEHKVMLGYRTREDATKAYRDGFSDGKGAERQRAVVRMSMKEFKHWLKSCDTKKPVRGQGHIDRAMSLTSRYTARHDRDAG